MHAKSRSDCKITIEFKMDVVLIGNHACFRKLQKLSESRYSCFPTNISKFQFVHVLYPDRIGIWNVGFFVEGRKVENPEKNPRSEARTTNNLNLRISSGRNQTRAALVGGERSHHCAIPAPLTMPLSTQVWYTRLALRWSTHIPGCWRARNAPGRVIHGNVDIGPLVWKHINFFPSTPRVIN